MLVTLVCAALGVTPMVQKNITYEAGGTKLEGVLVYEEGGTPRPGLVLVPNWLGINAANLKQAAEVARRGYVVFVADMYGAEGRPTNMEQAGKASAAVKGDRPLMRTRVAKALEVLESQKGIPLANGKLGAIGFCFGGTAVLELARSGAKVGAVVSFHGGLSSPSPADAKNITAKVLVLHGADDPSVPPAEVQAFENEMRAANVDWQLVAFGNAVHSFTDPDANRPGRSEYNPLVARRAFTMMDALFAEVFGR